MTEKIKTSIYIRVSTEKQVGGFSLEIQEEKCRNMAKVKDWVVTKVYSDAGVSGTLNPDDRPGLNQLIQDAKDKLFDSVIIYSLDRLGRTSSLVLNLIDRFKEMGIKLSSCKESLDTSTPTGAFFVNMISAIVQLERDNIVSRTKEGIEKRKKLDGDGGGILPYGYTRKDNEVVINPDEAEIVKLIFKLKRVYRLTQMKIVKHLNKEGIKSPRGTEWQQGTISKILQKAPIYEGGLRNNNENGIHWPKIIHTYIYS